VCVNTSLCSLVMHDYIVGAAGASCPVSFGKVLVLSPVAGAHPAVGACDVR
jgi:hypothetical protein